LTNKLNFTCSFHHQILRQTSLFVSV